MPESEEGLLAELGSYRIETKINMDVRKHIERDMAALGCSDRTKIALALQLYLELVDVQRAHDVEYCYSAELDELYCLARAGKGERLRLYVPRAASRDVTPRELRDLQLQLCTVETGPSVNLAFVEGDSTIVIYNFSAGLPDLTTLDTQCRRARPERRMTIDSELRRRRKTILQDALDGGNVDDNDVELLS